MAESASEDCRCHEVVKQTATTKQTKKIIWLRWTNTLKMHLYRLEMRMIKCIHVCRSAFCEFNFSCSELIIMSFATSNKGGSEFVWGFFFFPFRAIIYATYHWLITLTFFQSLIIAWHFCKLSHRIDLKCLQRGRLTATLSWRLIASASRSEAQSGFLGVFFAHSGTTKIPNTRCGQSTHRKVVIGILTGTRKRLCKFFFL